MRARQATSRLKRLAAPLAALVLALALALLAGQIAFDRFLGQSAASGRGTLRLAAAALEGQLERYEPLPAFIATQDPVRRVLREPDNPQAVAAANRFLKSINALLESSDIYVMLTDGRTVAASNYDSGTSFVGENFRYRPYFQDAAEGRRGRFYGLGTTSGRRGYYFSAPVPEGDDIAGVAVFKVELDAIEASWVPSDPEIVVTDPEGIVFMAGRESWRFRAYAPPDAPARARLEETRRYAERPLTPLGLAPRGTFDGNPLVGVALNGERREYLVLAEEMPEAGWFVRVFVDTAPARTQAAIVGLAAFLLLGLAALGLTALRQRRLRLAERMRHQEEAQVELERRVGERTAALAVANRRLEEEVCERRAAEETLRKTQADLVEAGKLAALGQMSAALSHEFNQPLAAAGAYADNAVTYLDRNRPAEARDNVLRISALVERLSSISRHLRAFARRPEDKLAPVDLAAAVESALEIAGWRLKAAGAEVEVGLDSAPLLVRGDSIRLSQVLINLVSNAADAVEGLPDRRIEIAGRRDGVNRVRITVADRGAGVPEAIAQRIFDPFFTTKGVGKGLGLGLSISYNIVRDFGGALSVERREGGGARFCVLLDAAEPAASAVREAAQAAE